jgi:hypothetical protein
MEASSAGKREHGGKGRSVKYWARLGCWISPCYDSSLGARFDTYEQFMPLIFNFSIFFSDRGKPWILYQRILYQWIRGHDCISGLNLMTDRLSLIHHCNFISSFPFQTYASKLQTKTKFLRVGGGGGFLVLYPTFYVLHIFKKRISCLHNVILSYILTMLHKQTLSHHLLLNKRFY